MDLKHTISVLIAVVLHTSFCTSALGQQVTKDGTALTWNRDLTVVSGTIAVNKVQQPAHTISIFETDATMATDLWKIEFSPIAATISSKPLKASGVRLPKLSEEPLVVYAESSTDKKANLAKLTLAIMLNDSTPLADEGEQERMMRDLAVRLNRAIVQQQLDRYQKELDKAADKLGGTQGDVAKSQKNLAKTNSDLEKIKSRRSKVERDVARSHGDIIGLERKFALSNDPKDLQRLTKARQKVTKGESAQAKLMQQEAKIQGNINKHQDTLQSQSKKADDHTEGKEDLMRIISELKRKQDSIR